MATSAVGVLRACEALSRRMLLECKLQGAPAHVMQGFGTCRIGTPAGVGSPPKDLATEPQDVRMRLPPGLDLEEWCRPPRLEPCRVGAMAGVGPWVRDLAAEPQDARLRPRWPPGLGLEGLPSTLPSPPPGLESPECAAAGGAAPQGLDPSAPAFEPASIPEAGSAAPCELDPAAQALGPACGNQAQAYPWAGVPKLMGWVFWPVQGPGREAVSRAPRRPAQRRACRQTLAESLHELESEDPACVVNVRQIHRLGLKASDLLQEHYEHFGSVRKILLSSAAQPLGQGELAERLRPARMGFVLMTRPQDAAAILAAGEMQVVFGKAITVRRFERRAPHSTDAVQDVAAAFQGGGDAEGGLLELEPRRPSYFPEDDVEPEPLATAASSLSDLRV